MDGLSRVLEGTKPFPLNKWDRRGVYNLVDEPKTYTSGK